MKCIPNVPALRALAPSEWPDDSLAATAGYWAPCDGGHATYYWYRLDDLRYEVDSDGNRHRTDRLGKQLLGYARFGLADPTDDACYYDDGGLVIAPDDSGMRGEGRWILVHDNVFNVKVFGAHGDGELADSHDDTAAVQAAFTAAAQLVVSSSGSDLRDSLGYHPVVHFPTGTYKLGTVEIPVFTQVTANRAILRPKFTWLTGPMSATEWEEVLRRHHGLAPVVSPTDTYVTSWLPAVATTAVEMNALADVRVALKQWVLDYYGEKRLCPAEPDQIAHLSEGMLAGLLRSEVGVDYAKVLDRPDGGDICARVARNLLAWLVGLRWLAAAPVTAEPPDPNTLSDAEAASWATGIAPAIRLRLLRVVAILGGYSLFRGEYGGGKEVIRGLQFEGVTCLRTLGGDTTRCASCAGVGDLHRRCMDVQCGGVLLAIGNVDHSNVRIEDCSFFRRSTAIVIDNDSGLTDITGCTWYNCFAAIHQLGGEVTVDRCWMTTAIPGRTWSHAPARSWSPILVERGNLAVSDLIGVPGVGPEDSRGHYRENAWIRAGEMAESVCCERCRFGGEDAAMTAVNCFMVPSRTWPTMYWPRSIIIEKCQFYARYEPTAAAVRLFSIPNQVVVRDNRGFTKFVKDGKDVGPWAVRFAHGRDGSDLVDDVLAGLVGVTSDGENHNLARVYVARNSGGPFANCVDPALAPLQWYGCCLLLHGASE